MSGALLSPIRCLLDDSYFRQSKSSSYTEMYLTKSYAHDLQVFDDIFLTRGVNIVIHFAKPNFGRMSAVNSFTLNQAMSGADK